MFGTAFLNLDGTVGIGFSTVLAPGGAFVHIEARIDLASLGGQWRDSAGRGGLFTITPASGTGGTPRPLTTSTVLGHEIVLGPNVDVSAGSLAPAAAQCPAGKQVLGGGYTLSGAGLRVEESAPGGGGQRWVLLLRNESGSSRSGLAWAICAAVQ